MLSDVAVDANGKVLAVADSSGAATGFYVSADAGASFTPLATAMFPDGIYAYGTTWYASTYSPGLGITTDGGATWTWRGVAQGVQARPRATWYAP